MERGRNLSRSPFAVSRRAFARLLCLSAVPAVPKTALGMFDWQSAQKKLFQHPGMLHSKADLLRIREGVKRHVEPVYSGFEKFRDDPHSQLSYRRQGASEEVGRNPTVRAGALEGDSNAAYQLALMGHITDDPRYFKLCAAILDDWAGTLKRITGADAILCAGLAPFKLANAAELLRASDYGWPAASVSAFAKLLRGVVLPVIDHFAPFANGNWDAAAMKTMLAIAIFTDDVVLFDRALTYYLHGCGDGRMEHYIYPSGQCQESGRDQQHTQLGLAHLGDCCEMAWQQGLDLYGALDNRLLRGFEYTARYEVGDDVPFEPDIDQTGKYRHAVISARSPLRAVYEQIYNHYAIRRGIAAPWTAKAAAQVRPEGPGFGADNTGFGTLLYSRGAGEGQADIASVGPAGLFAENVGDGIQLTWTPPVRGGAASIVRTSAGGTRHFAVNSAAGVFLDRKLDAATEYEYRIDSGTGGSVPRIARAIAGMPGGWAVEALGGDLPRGEVFSSRDIWRMTAGAGNNTEFPAGGLMLVSRAVTPEASFSARLSPVFASQQLCAGIACLQEDGGGVLLLLAPGSDGISEHIAWTMQLWTRERASGKFVAGPQTLLTEPVVSYGRVYLPLSMRLRNTGAWMIAEFGTGTSSWSRLGEWKQAHGRMRVGMAMSSGVRGVLTETLWDEVTVAALPKGSGSIGLEGR